MHEKLRAALDSVHAEPELKAATRAAVARRIRQRPARALRLAPAVCAVMVILGGPWLYFTPTAHISIDINPSLELGINRFDRVISVEGWNDDGTALAETLDVTHLSYTDAVEHILSSDPVQTLLESDAAVEIGVFGDNASHCARLLAGVEACTNGRQNAHCYQAGSEEVEQAHNCGLSYGKYRAYLELAALDPSVTVEQVQGMTMRQIRERIAALSDSAPAAGSAETPVSGNHQNQQTGPGHHGAGHHGE